MIGLGILAFFVFMQEIIPVNKTQAINAMKNTGFSNVMIVNSSRYFSHLRGCTGNGKYTHEAIGANVDGKVIHATVCCNDEFKSCKVLY
jgi:uncharacterized linocin/CFP29 family protein